MIQMSSSETSSTINQYGFFFDQSRCSGCQTCAISCKSWNLLPPGPVKWLRIFQWETGTFPTLRMNTLFAPCYHCEGAPCVAAANGAMFKEPKYGAVLIDPSQANSANLKAAWEACPFGAIVFDSDAPDSNASKCTMCVDRLEQGLLPACVTSCPMRALDFGLLSDLKAKYPYAVTSLSGMPDVSSAQPAVIFKPQDPKTQLVSYDVPTALSLLATRPNGLPPVYTSTSDVTTVPDGMLRKNALNMKPSSIEELIVLTQDSNS